MGLDIYQVVVLGWKVPSKLPSTKRPSCCHTEQRKGCLFCPVCGTAVRDAVTVKGEDVDYVVKEPLFPHYFDRSKERHRIVGVQLHRSDSHRTSPIRAINLSGFARNLDLHREYAVAELRKQPLIMQLVPSSKIEEPQLFSVLDISS